MKSLYRSAAAVAKTVLDRNDDGGPIYSFDYLRSSNPDDTAVPALARDDGYPRVFEFGVALQLGNHLGDDLSLRPLPGCIVFVHVRGELHGRLDIGSVEQFDGVACAAHSTD